MSELALLFVGHCKPPKHTKRTAQSYGNRALHFVEWAEKNHIELMVAAA